VRARGLAVPIVLANERENAGDGELVVYVVVGAAAAAAAAAAVAATLGWRGGGGLFLFRSERSFTR
jgi:hypothetical protein